MSKDQETILLIKGAITELTPAEQEAVKKATEQIRAALQEAGALGGFALALIGAELQAQGS